MAKLILFEGSKDERHLDLDGLNGVTLGRAPTNDVVVGRRMASRLHARIERRGPAYYVVDTDSYNGTFVNNRPVRESQLVHGDEIRLGSFLVRFLDTPPSVLVAAGADPADTLRVLPASAPKAAPATRRAAPEELVAMGALDDHAVTADDARILAPPEDERPTGPIPRPTLLASAPALPTPAAAAPATRTPAADATSRSTASTARAASASPAPDRRIPLAGILVALSLGAALGTVALLRRGGSPPASPTPPPSPSEETADAAALRAALAAPPSDRQDRLWDFVSTYPQSDRRAEAYAALLDLGTDAGIVCDHARRNAPRLLETGQALRGRCGP